MFRRGASLLLLISLPALAADPQPKTVAPGVLRLGTIQDPEITECSGLIASRQYPEVFWTHNDGKREKLFAITRDGKTIAEFHVRAKKGASYEVKMKDWEDIAIDAENNLYASDTGNNDCKRTEVAVYRFPEPDPKSGEKAVHVRDRWILKYPGQPFDCESLAVQGTNAFVVSKVTHHRMAELFRFTLNPQKEAQTLQLVGRLMIDSPATAADISLDGKRFAVLAKSGPFIFSVDGDIAAATRVVPKHKLFPHETMEACTFVPEGLLVACESREIFLFTDEVFRTRK